MADLLAPVSRRGPHPEGRNLFIIQVRSRKGTIYIFVEEGLVPGILAANTAGWLLCVPGAAFLVFPVADNYLKGKLEIQGRDGTKGNETDECVEGAGVPWSQNEEFLLTGTEP